MTQHNFWSGLRMIELAPGEKIPRRAWGGFGQDLSEAEHVLTPNELEPGKRYGYIAHEDGQLGVLDFDLYKDKAPSDLDAIGTSHEPLLVRSPSGGLHMPFLMPHDSVARTKTQAQTDDGPSRQLTVREGLSSWVDLKGEAGGGHCVLPFGTDYEVTGGDEVPRVMDPGDTDELWDLATVNDEPVLECEEVESPPDGLADLKPPGELAQALPDGYTEGRRYEHPFHGSSSGANFYVFEGGKFWYCYRHECGGTLLHLLGMKYDAYDCGEWRPMEDGERAELHRDVRRRALDEGYDIETSGRRMWTADTDGLVERLGAVK